MVKKPVTTMTNSIKILSDEESHDRAADLDIAEFNSAVETLLHKIDRIEQSQGQLVASSTKITEAIYDPTDGIFAKLASQKLESFQQFSQLDTKLASVTAWKQFHTSNSVAHNEKLEKTDLKVTAIETFVAESKKTKEIIWSITKWALVALGGGAITLAFKYLGQYIFNLH